MHQLKENMWFAAADRVDVHTIGSGQCIRNHVGFSFQVTNVCCKFSDASELIGLTCCQGICLLVETRHYGLLVCEDGESSTFHHVAEVADRAEDS